MTDLLSHSDLVWYFMKVFLIGFWFLLVGGVGVIFIAFEPVRNFFLKFLNIEIEFDDM